MMLYLVIDIYGIHLIVFRFDNAHCLDLILHLLLRLVFVLSSLWFYNRS